MCLHIDKCVLLFKFHMKLEIQVKRNNVTGCNQKRSTILKEEYLCDLHSEQLFGEKRKQNIEVKINKNRFILLLVLFHLTSFLLSCYKEISGTKNTHSFPHCNMIKMKFSKLRKFIFVPHEMEPKSRAERNLLIISDSLEMLVRLTPLFSVTISLAADDGSQRGVFTVSISV